MTDPAERPQPVIVDERDLDDLARFARWLVDLDNALAARLALTRGAVEPEALEKARGAHAGLFRAFVDELGVTAYADGTSVPDENTRALARAILAKAKTTADA